MDAGGGSRDDLNWLLMRGYQLHCKDFSSKRAEAWAATVQEWLPDPHHPDRQFGWVIPQDTADYVRPVKRMAIRWRKRNGQLWHHLLISTLEPREVMQLLGRPINHIYEPELVALAYAQLYDQRAGAIEIEFKEDKQGVGLTKRRKKRAPAQQMIVLLNSLAHNVLVWARRWMSKEQPKLKRYGIMRLVRDVFGVSGFLETTEDGRIKRLILNESSQIARSLHLAFQALLSLQEITVELGST
ncbi:MAG: transposase [Acidobacteria bacterium]|nr:transposase [Acidobacteriota bacterium]